MITLNTIADTIASLTKHDGSCMCIYILGAAALSVVMLLFTLGKVKTPFKVIGMLINVALLAGSGYIVYKHLCLYTIVAAVIELAVFITLSVALLKKRQQSNKKRAQKSDNSQCEDVQGQPVVTEQPAEEQSEKPQLQCGYYLVSKNDDGDYGFVLCDADHNVVLRSYIAFDSVKAATQGIEYCRSGATNAQVQYLSDDGLGKISYPRFAMYRQEGGYVYRLDVSQNFSVAVSDVLADYDACEKAAEQAKALVVSADVRVADNQQ